VAKFFRPTRLRFETPPNFQSEFALWVVVFYVGQRPFNEEHLPMEWTTPQHEEIDLNCEVSSYANAEL
jgi:hypothetical protein